MKLYHGTNTPQPIIQGKMREGTWLAENLFHAFRIAERRSTQRGGKSVVVEIESDEKNFHREIGRNLSTYKFLGGGYKALSTYEMNRTELGGLC